MWWNFFLAINSKVISFAGWIQLEVVTWSKVIYHHGDNTHFSHLWFPACTSHCGPRFIKLCVCFVCVCAWQEVYVKLFRETNGTNGKERSRKEKVVGMKICSIHNICLWKTKKANTREEEKNKLKSNCNCNIPIYKICWNAFDRRWNKYFSNSGSKTLKHCWEILNIVEKLKQFIEKTEGQRVGITWPQDSQMTSYR